MKQVYLVAVMCLIGMTASAQFWTEDFETDGDGVRYFAGADDEFNDGTSDHYGRTDGSTTSGSYVSPSNSFYWAGEDIDDNGGNGNNPKTLTFASQSIVGMNSVTIGGLFAQGSAGGGGLDVADFMRIEYQVDGGGWSTAFQFHGINNGDTSNNGAALDTNQDGTGDGTPLTPTFAAFDATVAVSGLSMEVRITMSANSGNEEFAYDLISLTDDSAPVGTDTEVEFTATSSSVTEDGLFVTVCASIINESATVATTVDVVLNGASTATNGTDYDDGAVTPAAVVFPITLTFPAASAADQCLDIFISVDDMDIEGNETIVLDLQNTMGGTNAGLGSDVQHTVTIVDNDLPDIVITEIVYNTATTFGSDDEWVEICNNGATTADISDFDLEIHNGAAPSDVFTIPMSSTLAPGACATIAVGYAGDDTGVPTDFNDACVFVPDYGIAITGAANTNNLSNTSRFIRLRDSFGTELDNVFYDDGDIANTDGGSSSMHVIDMSVDNSNTVSNWAEVATGGSPGVFSLTSNCAPTETSIQFTASSITVNEGDGTFQVCLSITNPDGGNATEAFISLGASGTALTPDDYDEDGFGTPFTYFGFSKDYVFFDAGVSANQCFDLTLIDDAINEGQETIVLVLDPADVAGGNNAFVGANGTLTINIADNDVPVVTPCSDLFFSEYIEGGSNNKCIEIYNPTSSEVDLATGGYAVYLYGNGATAPSNTLMLTGSLCPGEVLVICNPSSTAAFLAESDISDPVTFFNGDDALQLVSGASTGVFGTSLDVIGVIGTDPGSAWTGGGCSTANRTLVRKSTIQSGDADGADAFDPSVEWDCLAQDTSTELGDHTSDCIAASVCSITAVTDGGTQSACDPATNTYSNTVTVEFTDAPTCGVLEVNGQSFVIGTSPQTVTLTGLTSDNLPVDVSVQFSADPACSMSATGLFTAPADCLPANTIVINELDYDQVGNDDFEFIELYNNGATAIDLSAYSVRLINGSGATSYNTIALPAVSLAANDYFVVCMGANTSAYCDMTVVGSIQNGAPEAVELLFAGNRVDVLSYEGSVTGFTEGGSAPGSDSNSIASIGLSRLPNGTDTDDNSADFAINCITPGAANVICAVNDNCAGAITLNSVIWGVPSWETYSLGATESVAGCAGDADDDIYFEFVAQSANTQIVAQDVAMGFDAVIEIFDGCSGASLGCFNNYGPGAIERATPTGLVVGNTYAFRLYDAASGPSASTDIRVQVKTYEDAGLQDSYCNVLDYTLDESVYAKSDDLGQVYTNPGVNVKGYEFRFVEQGTSNMIDAQGPAESPYIVLADVGGLEYGKTYDVSVRHRVRMRANGGFMEYWSEFSTSCPIALGAAIPATQLSAADCGSIDVELGDNIQAVPVADASMYRFTLVGGGATLVKTVPSYGFLMYTLPGVTYGTVYQVTVESQVDGVWSAAGAPCSLGMAVQPAAIDVQNCGVDFNYPAPNALLAEQVLGATMYHFRFIPTAGGATLDEYTSGLSMAFHLVDNVFEDGEYSVDVQVMVGGEWSDFGNACNITINGGLVEQPNDEDVAAKQIAELVSFSAEVYPNPSNGEQLSVSLEALTVQGQVVFELFDITGKRVLSESRAIKGESATVVLSPEARLEAGTYILNVIAGDAQETLRVVVK